MFKGRPNTLAGCHALPLPVAMRKTDKKRVDGIANKVRALRKAA
jgi:hypothetical protein